MHFTSRVLYYYDIVQTGLEKNQRKYHKRTVLQKQTAKLWRMHSWISAKASVCIIRTVSLWKVSRNVENKDSFWSSLLCFYSTVALTWPKSSRFCFPWCWLILQTRNSMFEWWVIFQLQISIKGYMRQLAKMNMEFVFSRLSQAES